MTILVTGATGFLGRRLVEMLVAGNGQRRVRVLVRPGPRVAPLRELPVEVVEGDLADGAALSSAVADVRTVYHCAALSSDWGPWESFYAANVLGVRNLAAAAARTGMVDRFVLVSSTDVYGYPTTACDEATPSGDAGLPYNRSKRLGEIEVQRCAELTGLPFTILRPASIYGPRSKDWVVEAGRLLLEGSMPFIAGGRSRAGLIYVDDVATAMTAAASTPRTLGQAYNLRHPADTTWRQFYDAFADGLGVRRARLDLPRPVAWALAWLAEQGYRAVSSSSRPLLTRHAVQLLSRDQGYPIAKARRDFGFEPQVGLDEGLARTLAWLETPEGLAAVPRTTVRRRS